MLTNHRRELGFRLKKKKHCQRDTKNYLYYLSCLRKESERFFAVTAIYL